MSRTRASSKRPLKAGPRATRGGAGEIDLPCVEPLSALLRPEPRRTVQRDPFGNPLEILYVESSALPAGLHSNRKTGPRVRIEVRRDPADPSRIAYVAPHRAGRSGLKAPAVEGASTGRADARADVPGPCGCPFALPRLLEREPTRFRIVPGQRLAIRDNLGGQESFEVQNTTVMGNAHPATPHQLMVIATRDHHAPLHRRPCSEVVDLVRVFRVLTAQARALGAVGIEIIKNRGSFAGGTVAHPHWQARILTERPPHGRRPGMSIFELARKEAALGRRVFFRRLTKCGQVLGWRAYAGFECCIAVTRGSRGRPVPAAHWLCDITAEECEAIGLAMRQGSAHYEAEGIEDYNVMIRQPAFVRRIAPLTDVFHIAFLPRGPGYQPAGFEIVSDYHVTFVSESPEAEARRMRSRAGRA